MNPAHSVRCPILFLFLALGVAAHAQGYHFSPIFAPGSSSTNTAGMNSAGDVVGNYDPSDGGVSHGYLYHQGAFSDIYFAGSHFTSPEGINTSGTIAGFYQLAGIYHGFFYSQGAYTSFDYPGASNTQLVNINNHGDVIGGSDAPNAGPFLYSNGTFTLINYPGAQTTEVLGLNDAQQIVGSYGGIGQGTHGFLKSGDTYTTIDFPGPARGTVLAAINNHGEILGYYIDAAFLNHAFLYHNGVFRLLPFPNLTSAYFTGFNDADQFVGWTIRRNEAGFLATPN